MDEVRIENLSRQMIPLQVKPPNGDFYVEEQQIRLSPAGKKGCAVKLPKKYLNMAQIENCKSRRFISVTEIG